MMSTNDTKRNLPKKILLETNVVNIRSLSIVGEITPADPRRAPVPTDLVGPIDDQGTDAAEAVIEVAARSPAMTNMIEESR
jgi:hypothetical protein